MAQQAQHEPQKVGEYERPVTRTSGTGIIIGIVAIIIALIVLAIIFF